MIMKKKKFVYVCYTSYHIHNAHDFVINQVAFKHRNQAENWIEYVKSLIKRNEQFKKVPELNTLYQQIGIIPPYPNDVGYEPVEFKDG